MLGSRRHRFRRRRSGCEPRRSSSPIWNSNSSLLIEAITGSRAKALVSFECLAGRATPADGPVAAVADRPVACHP
jgi:hypothetical protein